MGAAHLRYSPVVTSVLTGGAEARLLVGESLCSRAALAWGEATNGRDKSRPYSRCRRHISNQRPAQAGLVAQPSGVVVTAGCYQLLPTAGPGRKRSARGEGREADVRIGQ